MCVHKATYKQNFSIFYFEIIKMNCLQNFWYILFAWISQQGKRISASNASVSLNFFNFSGNKLKVENLMVL